MDRPSSQIVKSPYRIFHFACTVCIRPTAHPENGRGTVQNGVTAVELLTSKNKRLRFLDIKGIHLHSPRSRRNCVPKGSRPPRLNVADWPPNVQIGRLRRDIEHLDVVRSPWYYRYMQVISSRHSYRFKFNLNNRTRLLAPDAAFTVTP
jgi:hypothetical protein